MTIKRFNYSTKGETKERNVFVIRETDTSIIGLDLNLLSEKEQTDIKEKLKNYEPRKGDDKSGEQIDNWNPSWKTAWRNFTKSKILPIEKDTK